MSSIIDGGMSLKYVPWGDLELIFVNLRLVQIPTYVFGRVHLKSLLYCQYFNKIWVYIVDNKGNLCLANQ